VVDTLFSALLHPPSDAGDYDQQLDVERHTSLPHLLRIVACCWIAYVAILYGFDSVLVARTPQLQLLPPLYYLLHAADALVVLGIAISPWVQRRLGRAFLPLLIVCLSVLPLLIVALVTPFSIGPISGSRGLVSLRFAPVVVIGVVLLAWNYPWNHVVRVNVAMLLILVAPTLGHLELAIATLVLAVLQMVGFLVLSYSICTLLKRLRQQRAALRAANHQLRQYAATLEHLTISRERNRVARELHDTLAHTLSSLSVQLETVKAYWEVDSQAAQALLDSALSATRSGLQETRRALDALRARPLDDVGLLIALCDMSEAVAELANVQLDLRVPDQLPVLEPATEQAIYRIAQEALANITHHAEAQHLSVVITSSETQFVMRIQDDGRGFELQERRRVGHFGLAGMAERAALIGGKLTITSAPGAGTLIELTLALDDEEEYARADL
jgi:signal transduction histidine kinase